MMHLNPLVGLRNTLILLGAVFLFLQASMCHGELYVEFLLDRSASMWTPIGDKTRLQVISDAIVRISREAPREVAIGLRVYPPRGEGQVEGDPGLRIPIRKGSRDLFPAELNALNPYGKDPLAEQLKKALGDFPKTRESKLLILIADGADTFDASFCRGSLFSEVPDGLIFRAFTIGLSDPGEINELNCLSNQLSGKITHLTVSDSLYEALMPVLQDACEEEAARISRAEEERRRREALATETRLRVEFRNTLDRYFADSVEIVVCRLDGRDIRLDGDPRIAMGEKRVIFDEPTLAGTYKLELQYKMWRGDESLLARQGTLEVVVAEGKTTFVSSRPRGSFFSWDIGFKTVIEPEP